MQLPAPIPDPTTQAFWDAAADGRFLVRSCRACGRAHWYPRRRCPHCRSDDTAWAEASGTGTIYSFTAVDRNGERLILAYVSLSEGPTMLTNIVGADVADLAIDQPVRVVFRQSDNGIRVPVFSPEAAR